MVIACPNCQRKYQIDTSRIPPTGTSFTCWSCRATVRVDAVGLATAQPPAPKEEGAPPAQVDEPTASAPLTPESNIPLSAMRFFESLAAEASLNQKMADQAAPPEPPVTERTTTATFASEPPEIDSDEYALAPEPSAESAAETSARVPHTTMDLLTGDDVLDLPPVVPAAAPVEEGRVLDLPGIDDEDESGRSGDTLEFAPLAPEPPKPTATQIFASEPEAPPAEPEPPTPPDPTPSPLSFEGLLPPEEPAAAPRPPARPRPTPIPLPAQAQEPPAPPEPVRFRGARPPATPPIEPETPQFPPPPPAVFPPPPEPPFASVRTPDDVVNPFSVDAPGDPDAALPANGPLRMTPAEIAVSQPAAWVAPRSKSYEPERSSSGKSRKWLALVALAVIAVVVAIWFRAGLLGFLKSGANAPAKAAKQPPTPAPQPPAQQPEPQQPAQQPQQPAEQPTDVAKTPVEQPAPKPEPTPSVGPSGAGNFTIQVRASPNEADAQSAAKALSAAGVDAYVVRADLGKKGVWYRVRVGRFASRDEASQAASKLRSAGRAGDAIVVGYDAP